MPKVSKKRKLVINTIIIFFSKLCTQLLTIFLLPFVTSKLSTNDYGTYDLITVYALLATAFMGLNIENGLFRFLIDARENKNKQRIIISSGFFTMVVITFCFSLIYFFSWLLFRFENAIYIYMFAIFSLYFNMLLQIARGNGDNVSYAIASIIVGISNILFIAMFLFLFDFGLWGMVYAASISYLLGGLYIFLKKRVYKYISLGYVNKNTSIGLLKYSVPLVPNNISSWIMNISDKVMLSYFINNSATGLYSISTKFPVLLSHIYGVFNLSWTESASINIKDKGRDNFFTEVINKAFIICFCLCIVTLAGMHIVFELMIDKSYSNAYYYIPILIFASSFEILSGLFGAIYISLKRTKNIAISTAVAGGINIIINFIFIPKIGIGAACISTAISYFILAAYRYFNIKKYVNIRMDLKKIIFLYLIFFALSSVYYFNSLIVSLISIIISILITVYINQKLFKRIIKTIQKKLRKQ